MTLLTLVENAVRHGIDPSEEGGRIDVEVRVRDGRCRAQVIDTGVGLQRARAADSAPGCQRCASACSSRSAATRSCA